MGVGADTHGKVGGSTVFISYSLHVSIVGFFTLRQKRINCGSTFVDGNSEPLQQHLLLARYTIVSVTRIVRPYTVTILSAAYQTHTHARTHAHARTPTHTRARTHARTHAHTHTHIHTHTHSVHLVGRRETSREGGRF